MEWQIALLLIFGGLIIMMAIGIPVAFCFIILNIIGVYFLWGGVAGLQQLILSFYDSVTKFAFMPLALFVLMGEIMFQSGIGVRVIDTLDKLLGRLPGRLGLLAVGSGTLLATLTGSSMASVAVLGSMLTPEMEKRGYKKSMSLGPILGSGGLAILIPPSNLAVVFGAIAEVSIGDLLLGIIGPGILLAIILVLYIIMRCRLQPSIAPAYEVQPTTIWEKLLSAARYILPIGLVIFLVTGVIFLGIATPSEAAATGAIGCFILAAFYRGLNWDVMSKIINSALKITGMIFLIILGSMAFSQIVAFSGAGRGLVTFTTSLPIAPIFILIIIQIVILFLGMFLGAVPIIMIVVPIFMPIVYALDFNPVWFGVILLLNLEIGTITPPYGMGLFVMKGVAPAGTTMGDCWRASLPFIGLHLLTMSLLIAFPSIVLWLPSMMIRG